MSDRGGLQLLPGTKKIDIQSPGEDKFLFSGVAVMLVVGGLFFGLSMYVSSLQDTLTQVQADFTALEKKRDLKSEQKLLAFSKHVEPLVALLKNHTFTSKGIDTLEKLMQAQVRVKELNILPVLGKITFTAVAKGYSDVARQIASLTADPTVKSVTVGTIKTNNEGLVEFDMQVDVVPEKFFRKAEVRQSPLPTPKK